MFKRNRALELTQSFLPESSAIRQFPLQKKFNGIAPSCNQTNASRPDECKQGFMLMSVGS